jgi:DNA-directed RNA polymerase specialized sigma24 family protein
MLRDLSPMQRGAFVLREVFGYDSSETASLLGSSEVAVRVHLHAARRRLRTFLDAESLR